MGLRQSRKPGGLRHKDLRCSGGAGLLAGGTACNRSSVDLDG